MTCRDRFNREAAFEIAGYVGLDRPQQRGAHTATLGDFRGIAGCTERQRHEIADVAHREMLQFRRCQCLPVLKNIQIADKQLQRLCLPRYRPHESGAGVAEQRRERRPRHAEGKDV